MVVVTLTVLSIAATMSKGASSLVGQTKVDKDIKVTISDVLYDGTRLSIGYVMEGSKNELKDIDDIHSVLEFEIR